MMREIKEEKVEKMFLMRKFCCVMVVLLLLSRWTSIYIYGK